MTPKEFLLTVTRPLAQKQIEQVLIDHYGGLGRDRAAEQDPELLDDFRAFATRGDVGSDPDPLR